ncbi:MAG: hypothetical protein F2754_02275 [Actinobacteria bacterium]|uniref:Unannotated protein n=1 Tax=freshwater metagenome TaxID=449393 RepID=A0A6J6RU36_9ZZZZ|nr:hypothetical protein [Actinomycetota bacterium]MSY70557.1 hypothetical protein [Actinomycetota bacterium]
MGGVTIWLVRHAKAGSRSAWSGEDSDRPLVPKGFNQAETIADQLAGEPVTRVLSSPSLRCQQTVAPLARTLGLTVEVHDALDEGHGPRGALELIDLLASSGVDAVLCSHGDVIPEVLDQLARRGVNLDEPGRCAKGSIWQLDVRSGSVASGTYGQPA